MTNMAEGGGFRLRGRHVLFGVAAFFGIIIAADTFFTVLALRTFPGQTSVTPYEDGLLYNRRIAQWDAQQRLGWRVATRAEPANVTLRFADRTGAPVRGLRITGRLERPATEVGRIALRFRETAPGLYAAPTGALAGAFDLTAEAVRAEGGEFQVEARLTWP